MYTTPTDVNQLVFVVVSERQVGDLLQALVKERFYFTKLDSSGLLFQESILCLLIGLNSSRLSSLIGLVSQYCQPFEEFVPMQFTPPAGLSALPMIEARVGGALVYVLEVERFEQF